MKSKFTLILSALLLSLQMYAGSVTVQISSGASASDMQTAMSNAVTAGNTDITLQFADGGVYGSSSSNISITVPAGVTKLTLYGAPDVTTTPTLYFNGLSFSDNLMSGGVTFDGLKLITAIADKYLMQPSTTNTPATYTLKNCHVEGYRAVFYCNSVVTINQVMMTGNIIKSITSSGIISTGTAASVISNITIRKNTIINSGGISTSDYFFDHRSANCASTVFNFSQNTIYSPATVGRGLFRLGTTPTAGNYKVNNNLFAPSTPIELRLGYGDYSTITTDADSTNYYSSAYTSVTRANNMLFTIYNESNPSILFVNAASGNFTINDPNFVGKSVAGDPRWWPQVITNGVNITTAVSPANSGSVTPSTITVNSGTDVTLTATADFGYSFKEWRNAENVLLSTNNPYTFTASADASLVAVFDQLTTYDFTLNYDGSGAQWGKVTLSPEPTNGKYVAGTEVTATVVPNGVTTFSKWDDNSTVSPKTVTVNSNTTLTATFDVIPFITGWDFRTGEPRNTRVGDYYTDDTNKGLLNIYNQDGSSTSWLSHTGWSSPSTPCAILWTGSTDFATNTRYWQATFSTLGYRNIQINSQMSGSYQYYTNQKIQISLNGTDFSDLLSTDITGSWTNMNATLPQAYEGQSTVYVRWKANTTSTLNGSGNDGTAITNIFVFADKIGTALKPSTQSNEYAYYNTDKLVVNNVEPSSIVSVYSFNGMLLAKQTAISNQVVFQVNTSCIIKITSNGRTTVLKAMK